MGTEVEKVKIFSKCHDDHVFCSKVFDAKQTTPSNYRKVFLSDAVRIRAFINKQINLQSNVLLRRMTSKPTKKTTHRQKSSEIRCMSTPPFFMAGAIRTQHSKTKIGSTVTPYGLIHKRPDTHQTKKRLQKPTRKYERKTKQSHTHRRASVRMVEDLMLEVRRGSKTRSFKAAWPKIEGSSG